MADDPDPEPELDEPDILFGQLTRTTKEEIIMSIPPRPVVDRLVAKYFQDEVAYGIDSSTATLLRCPMANGSEQEFFTARRSSDR